MASAIPLYQRTEFNLLTRRTSSSTSSRHTESICTIAAGLQADLLGAESRQSELCSFKKRTRHRRRCGSGLQRLTSTGCSSQPMAARYDKPPPIRTCLLHLRSRPSGGAANHRVLEDGQIFQKTLRGLSSAILTPILAIKMSFSAIFEIRFYKINPSCRSPEEPELIQVNPEGPQLKIEVPPRKSSVGY